MNKTATPGTRQAAEGLSTRGLDPGERLMSALDDMECCAALVEGLMEQASDRGDKGTAQILCAVHLRACGACDEVARYLGVQVRC